MRRSGKILLILFVNMLILGLATFGLEFKLAQDRRKAEAKWSKQVTPIIGRRSRHTTAHCSGTRSLERRIRLAASVPQLRQLTEPKNPALFDQ